MARKVSLTLRMVQNYDSTVLLISLSIVYFCILNRVPGTKQLVLLQKFNLENSVSLENCRIVKYDEYNENIELSFEGKEVPFLFFMDGVWLCVDDAWLHVRVGDTWLPVHVCVDAWLDVQYVLMVTC